MTISTVRFNEVTMRRKIRIHCPECGKKRYKTISRSYFRNGFHNESETRDKYNKELDNETAKLQLKGIICSPCENKGKPVELTIRDIHPGDELVTYNKVYAVKEINTTGRNRTLVLEGTPNQVVDKRCPGYGKEKQEVWYREGKSLHISEVVWIGESLWRDGKQIYPQPS